MGELAWPGLALRPFRVDAQGQLFEHNSTSREEGVISMSMVERNESHSFARASIVSLLDREETDVWQESEDICSESLLSSSLMAV